jgi:hypothetical protein
MSSAIARANTLVAIGVAAIVLAACSSAGPVPAPPSALVSGGTSSAAPTSAPVSPSSAPSPTAAHQPIADGTYVSKPLDVKALIARIRADKKLTEAQRNHLISNAFELPGHKTFDVSLRFQAGNWVEQQGFDGASGEIGARGTYAFPDDHTLVMEDPCCGTTTFDIAVSGSSFTLKRTSAPPDEEDRVAGHELFESSPFTLAP